VAEFAAAADKEQFAARQYDLAAGAGIRVHGYKTEYNSWRGASGARLTIGLYRALWARAGKPKSARRFFDFVRDIGQ
jgi:hypothetical protein